MEALFVNGFYHREGTTGQNALSQPEHRSMGLSSDPTSTDEVNQIELVTESGSPQGSLALLLAHGGHADLLEHGLVLSDSGGKAVLPVKLQIVSICSCNSNGSVV